MMIVDKKKCIGCSLWVNDCIVSDINLVDGKANINNITCIKCGHCIAVCPKNAVSTDEYNMEDVKDYNREDFEINEDNLLNFIKFRRSIRNFNNLTEETMKFKTYAEMWVQMYEDYKVDPKKGDKLFFNAPAVILVLSNSQVNGALASSNMELMTNALGLGTFFSGFFIRAAQGNKKIMNYLGLDENKQIVTCMVIGYPNIKYSRTTPRKNAEINWM